MTQEMTVDSRTTYSLHPNWYDDSKNDAFDVIVGVALDVGLAAYELDRCKSGLEFERHE